MWVGQDSQGMSSSPPPNMPQNTGGCQNLGIAEDKTLLKIVY